MRPSFRRDDEGTGPKDETFELFLGSVIVGFILRQRGRVRVVAQGRRVEVSTVGETTSNKDGLEQRSATHFTASDVRHNASAGTPGTSGG